MPKVEKKRMAAAISPVESRQFQYSSLRETEYWAFFSWLRAGRIFDGSCEWGDIGRVPFLGTNVYSISSTTNHMHRLPTISSETNS